MITGGQTRVPGAALSHLVYKTKKIAVVGDALIPQPNPRNVASPVNTSALLRTDAQRGCLSTASQHALPVYLARAAPNWEGSRGRNRGRSLTVKILVFPESLAC